MCSVTSFGRKHLDYKSGFGLKHDNQGTNMCFGHDTKTLYKQKDLDVTLKVAQLKMIC